MTILKINKKHPSDVVQVRMPSNMTTVASIEGSACTVKRDKLSFRQSRKKKVAAISSPKREIRCRTRAASLQNRLEMEIRGQEFVLVIRRGRLKRALIPGDHLFLLVGGVTAAAHVLIGRGQEVQ